MRKSGAQAENASPHIVQPGSTARSRKAAQRPKWTCSRSVTAAGAAPRGMRHERTRLRLVHREDR